MKPKFPLFPSVSPLVPMVISLAFSGLAGAQTFTWDGGGGDDLFGTGTNWAGDASPGVGSGVILQFDGATRPTPDNNYSTGDDFGSLLLLSSATADFTITGNGFGLHDKIENQAGSGQNFAINTAGIFARDGSIELNPVGGNLSIGGSITLDNNATVNVYDGDNGNTLTLNGVLSAGNGSGGDGQLILNQTATVILADDNTYGGTTLNSGTTLRVGTGGTTGTLGVGNTANDGSLFINRSNDYSYGGIISGSGSLTKQGAGTLTLTGTNSYGGKTTVTGGSVSISSDANLGTAPESPVADQLTLDGGTLRVTGATTLNANRGITVGSSGGTIDTSSLGTSGASQVIIAGAFTGTTGLTVSSHGNLSASGGGSDAFLQFAADNSSLSGGIAITSGVVDALTNNAFGSNQITLSNGGGILDANHNVTLANNIVASTGGGTIRLYGSATTTLSGTISGSTSLNRTDGGTLNFTGDMSGFTGTFNQQAGNTNFRNGATALTGTLTVSAGTASIENTAANTYSAVNLNGGTLRIKSNNGALGNATLAVGGNATLASQLGSTALTLANNATISGTNTLSVDAGYAAITWNGNITGTGTKVRTSSSGTLTLGGTVNMGSTSSGNVSVESSGTMTLASTAVVTAGSVFNNNNSGALNINGATVDTGTLNLSSNGSINLNSGTVTAAQVTLTNQTGTLNVAGGTLNTQYLNIGNGSNNSGRVIQTGGTVNVNSGGTGFRIGHWNNGANAGSLYNLSGGVLDATGLAANAGSSRLVNIGWDGQGDMIVGGGAGSATLKAYGIQLDANGNGGGAAPSTGNMTLTISTNGLVEVGAGGIGAASTSDSTIFDGGTLQATSTATWSGGAIVNAGGGMIDVGTGLVFSRNGGFSGDNLLTKTGEGTLKFQSYGSGAFNGSLLVSGGVAEFAGGAFNGNIGLSAATVADGATLLVSSAHALGGYIAATPSITVDSGGTLTFNRENYLSSIDLTGALVNGTSEVRTDNNFAVAVHADANPTVWSAKVNTVQANASFNVDNGAELQLDGEIYNSKGLTKSGEGLMVISATQSFTGGTTVNGGILQINGGGGTATGAIRGTLTINDGAQTNLNQGDALGYGSGADSISAININDSGVLHRIGGANETLGNVAITMDGGTISSASSGMGYDLFGGATTITVNNAAAEVARESLISARIDLRQTNSLFTVNENAVLRVNTIGDDGGTTLTKAGVGTMIIDGDNSFSQAVNVTAGTLRMNGDHSGTGLFTVDSGATLIGPGSIAGTINVSGVLAPGASIESLATGSLSMAAGSTLDFEIQDATGSGADLLAITGDFSLSGLVDLNLSKIGTGTWSINDKLTIASYTGIWNNGLFSLDGNSVADDSTFNFDGEEWVFNYNDTAKGNNFASEAVGTYVTMTVVPEPRAAFLGMIGLLALLRRRR